MGKSNNNVYTVCGGFPEIRNNPWSRTWPRTELHVRKRAFITLGVSSEHESCWPRLVRVMGISLCFILLLGIATGNQYNPRPNPDSVVNAKNARFTILTSRLIRMEWGQSLDAATFTFINRNLVKPSFTVKQNGSWTYIETDELKVS